MLTLRGGRLVNGEERQCSVHDARGVSHGIKRGEESSSESALLPYGPVEEEGEEGGVVG